METRKKLTVLADAAKYDASCASSGAKRARVKGGIGNTTGMGICHSYTPDGRCVSLLKVLFTNVCIYDCQYCVNRISSDIERATFAPAELAQLVIDFYQRNYIEGLFLSSGVWRSPDATLERMIEVARILREDHKFGGYIHLKIIPNASRELVERAGLLADRLSANIELPTERDLARLAPEKKLVDVDRSMNVIKLRSDEAVEERKKTRRAPQFAPAGQSTQMIVGATATTDGEVLGQTERLYRVHRLRRVYYSAYSPIPRADPRLPAQPISAVREHRLYQADWLLRFYGYKVDELLTPGENLDLTMDPKSSWALSHRAAFPVDVERGSREQLLRIPGMGVRSVDRILRARRLGRIRLEDLARLGVAMTRARWFVTTADHNPSLALLDTPRLRAKLSPVEKPVQLGLFA